MLICTKCGRVIDEDSLVYHIEPHGERRADDCYCGGEFVAAVECEICGKFMPDVDSRIICDSCIEENTTFEVAREIGEQNKEKIEINGFFFDIFTEEEIDEILLEFAKKKCLGNPELVKNYTYNDDVWYFEDWLLGKLDK